VTPAKASVSRMLDFEMPIRKQLGSWREELAASISRQHYLNKRNF
jgi:hypothetical protein